MFHKKILVKDLRCTSRSRSENDGQTPWEIHHLKHFISCLIATCERFRLQQRVERKIVVFNFSKHKTFDCNFPPRPETQREEK